MIIWKKTVKRIISMALILTMLVSFVTGCGKPTNFIGSELNDDDIQEIIQDTTNEIINNIDDYIVPDGNFGEEKSTLVSYSWEDYQGDVETFVYGVFLNDMQYLYDVFPAYVTLENGMMVSGIGYTDYSSGYTDEDETIACFEAGFIASCGEICIPQEEIEDGLVVNDLDYQKDDTCFVMAYQPESFIDHCVVYNQYVKYGIDAEGRFFYEAETYEKDNCDETLGSLYSYDAGRYLYDSDVGDYIGITGESLSSIIDFEEYEREINRILETQDKNFAQVDIETYAFFSQEAITNYLLSIQDETFMGYNVDVLLEAVRGLDPMECYRITKDGFVTIDLEHSTEEQVAQWLVGTACVITVAVGMVASVVFLECPPLSACSSAVVGVAVEVFMQVVISGKTVSDVDWCKVGVAACAGAVSGLLGPYIAATTSGVVQFVSDSMVDGLIGGMEQAVYAWMEGADGKEIINRFGSGLAMGFALSAGFKAASSLVGAAVRKAAPCIEKFAKEKLPKLSQKVPSVAKKIKDGIYKMKKMADGTIFHSQYISRKIKDNQLWRLVKDGHPELKKKSFYNLAKNNIFDKDGNPITKEMLDKIFDDANNNQIIGYFIMDGEMINIKKQNGIVGIVFDETKYPTVSLQDGIVNDRDANFLAAAKQFKDEWIKDPAKIPESISAAIDKTGIGLEDLEAERIVSIVKDRRNGWVFHENIDMRTVTLVPRRLHDAVQGGVTHMGGYALANYLKYHMAIEFFDRLRNAASSAVVQVAS